jgi:hypothetical protein
VFVRAIVIRQRRLLVLRDHTNRVCGAFATMYRRERNLWWSGYKLVGEDDGEQPGRGYFGDPLTHRKDYRLSTELLG